MSPPSLPAGIFDVPRRLSALDNAFLAVESASPMHVSGLAVYNLEPGPDLPLDIVRRGIVRLLPHVPDLRRRLLPALPGFPRAWGRPGSVDLAKHLHSVRLSDPGAPAQLYDLAAELHEQRLNRDRPLWEVWVITGLDDGLPAPRPGEPPRGSSFAVLLKVHHAAVDGLTAMTIFAGLHQRRPFDAESANGQVAAAARPAGGSLSGVRALADESLDTLVAPLRSTLRVAKAVRQRRGGQHDPALLLPWTRLNGAVSPQRCIATVKFAMNDVRRIRALVAGSTANDVALAAIGGALREWLSVAGIPPATDIVAGVPIVRTRPAADVGGNAFDLLRIPLGVTIAEPSARLAAIYGATSAGKPSTPGAAELNDGAQVVPGWLLNLAVQSSSALNRIGLPLPGVHTIVTNVSGPRFPLYLERAELSAIHAIGPIANGLAVFHAVTSYRGEIALTVTSSPAVIGDAADYVHQIAAAFNQLREASAEPTPP